VYPNGKRFETEEQQDEYVHKWLDDAGLGDEGKKVSLVFYKGRYHAVSNRYLTHDSNILLHAAVVIERNS
jgi:hypothetical protein